MASKNFMQNPYVMLIYCLLFVFLSSFTITVNPAMYIVVFILVTITSFLVRPLTESYLKPTCYFLLGSLSYWLIARELVISSGGPEPAVFILFGLAILNGLAALVSYSDGEVPGQAFIAGSLLLLFLNLSDKHSFLSGVLIFAASSSVVYYVFRIRGKANLAENIIKASVLSSVFLYCAAFSQFWNGLRIGVYPLPSAFVFGSSIVYLIALSAFVLWLTINVFEFFLVRFGYSRSVDGETVTYAILRQEKPDKQPLERKERKRR